MPAVTNCRDSVLNFKELTVLEPERAHTYAADIPTHPQLCTNKHTNAEITLEACTSLLLISLPRGSGTTHNTQHKHTNAHVRTSREGLAVYNCTCFLRRFAAAAMTRFLATCSLRSIFAHAQHAQYVPTGCPRKNALSECYRASSGQKRPNGPTCAF